MQKQFNPRKNYDKTRKDIGFVPLKQAGLKDWKRIGFMSGLEVHQQLKTDKKLFCRCPAGLYQEDDDFDGELIRHMRPTLSEMGEYDGTALMEFKTRKEIIYRLNNKTACTYEIDDTPPFKINEQALQYALEISLLSNLNIVGEVHITRKQYLDGSIPTGFQRTAILGVEGEIQLSNKKVRLIQLSIEEDSCREISDIGHTRVYKTDRLGVPLIETVTYPDMLTPYELQEAAEYIRFLNRSTGKVRTGIGAGREDTNVSCYGGTRVEIKGVAHNKWLPLLSHNEAFRQYALLAVKKQLIEKVKDFKNWKINTVELNNDKINTSYPPLQIAKKCGQKIIGVNLPGFHSILSHFTQPDKVFADEITDRLKVIACIEKPNMVHSESFNQKEININFPDLAKFLEAGDQDAQIVLWGPEEDISTALETVEERCKMAFEGVPGETRKYFQDGTTIFERVLPGANRMYPDTDSAPIPLAEDYINSLGKNQPVPVFERLKQMTDWGIPKDAHKYLLKKNLLPLIDRIFEELEYQQKYIGTFLAHFYKHLEGRKAPHQEFTYSKIFGLFAFLKKKKLDPELAKGMLEILFDHPNMEFNSVLTSVNFRRLKKEALLAPVGFLINKFREIRYSDDNLKTKNWLMGQLRKQAIGNISLSEYSKLVEKEINDYNHTKEDIYPD
jgi:glutamyl-tRNA(Gln) amidotransferase subunit E